MPMNLNSGPGNEPKPEAEKIVSGRTTLGGEVSIPKGAGAVVLFAHGSGSSRHSPRNQQVARTLRAAGLGTVLFDLLTEAEEEQDMKTRHLRFDITLLAGRLADATRWVISQPSAQNLKVGYFGSSTGAAAALTAAAELPDQVGAVVSRGGRPDLAGAALPEVKAATLLLVGERDEVVVDLNKQALAKLRCEKELKVIPRATHLFEEAGTLEEAARLAVDWFRAYLR